MRFVPFRLASGCLVVLLAASTALAQSPVPNVPFLREAHPPIFINGDAEFLNPLNGVRSGNGGSAPYRISGWQIDVGVWTVGGLLDPPVTTTAIRLRDTTANVIIDDNELVNAGIAILLENVTGTITIGDNVIVAAGSGIRLIDVNADLTIDDNSVGGSNGINGTDVSGDLAITDNTLNGNPIAIARGTADITIEGNVLTTNGTRGIFLSQMSGTVDITDNRIAGSPEHAPIFLSNVSSTPITILSNTLTCPGVGSILPAPGEVRAGIYAESTNAITIEDNKIVNCRHGLRLMDTTATVEKNCFEKNMNGVLLESGSGATTINENDFIDNQGLAVLKEIQGGPAIDATSNFWNRTIAPLGPNQFGDGPERTYPPLNSEIDVSNPKNARQTQTCGSP